MHHADEGYLAKIFALVMDFAEGYHSKTSLGNHGSPLSVHFHHLPRMKLPPSAQGKSAWSHLEAKIKAPCETLETLSQNGVWCMPFCTSLLLTWNPWLIITHQMLPTHKIYKSSVPSQILSQWLKQPDSFNHLVLDGIGPKVYVYMYQYVEGGWSKVVVFVRAASRALRVPMVSLCLKLLQRRSISPCTPHPLG